MAGLLTGVTWFRQSSIRIRRDGMELYVDPVGIFEPSQADFILLTHPHYDSFSEEDITRVRGPQTILVAPVSMKKQLPDADHFMRPGDMLQLDGFDVLVVPAYNVDRKFHQREDGWLGYVFTVGGVTYYHTGDTDFLDSMYGIRCDVAFVPCVDRYTIGPDDAARVGEAVHASLLVPIHWGDTAGSREDADRVSELYSGEVAIFERSQEG